MMILFSLIYSFQSPHRYLHIVLSSLLMSMFQEDGGNLSVLHLGGRPLCMPSLFLALFDELISTFVSGLSLMVVLDSMNLPGGWCLHELIELVDAAELLPDGWCSTGVSSSVSDSES